MRSSHHHHDELVTLAIAAAAAIASAVNLNMNSDLHSTETDRNSKRVLHAADNDNLITERVERRVGEEKLQIALRERREVMCSS